MLNIRLLASSVVLAALSCCASAAVYNATPSTYTSLMAGLRPGDTLSLAPGTYPRLNVTGVRGTPTAWITITGPASGSPATIVGAACCNTVEILNSSYVAIQNLTIDSLGIDGVAGISAKDGSSNLTHDILIQNNILTGQNYSQQTDGISTKTPTWGWIIRNNTIIGAGTGMYLGDSSGTSPFFAGTIENNLIRDTIGYNMQIKWQLPRPSIAGMPTGQSFTIIRNNVFIKNDQPSPDGDRPNVLVGGFPTSGPGSTDMYEIYGNFFYHNPREALFQASGRVSVHDNVFVDGKAGGAVVFQNHDLPLQLAYVYNNTIYTAGRGIYFGSSAPAGDAVLANLVFAATPISGSIQNLSGNITDAVANAPLYVNSPSFTLGAMDFYPLAGKAQGSPFDLSRFVADPDYAVDFNGTAKNAAKQAFVFRGAYAGEGVNPGWKLQAGIKGATAPQSPALAALQCAPATLASGQQSACIISMTAAPSNATTVSLASSNPAVSLPSSVTIPAGATFTSFSAVAGAITANATAVLTATLPGTTQSATATLQLTAPPATTPGTLAGSLATPSGAVDLTAQGTADWAHWGLTTVTSFDQKAGVPHQISNYTVVGTRAPSRYANNSVGFTWTDGTPTLTATNSTTGVYVVDQGNGFRITAPADTATRTLKVYVGAWRSRGRIVAHLSDGSAVDYTDNSVSNAGGATTLGVYMFTFTAGSAGQTLTVTFTQDTPTVSGIIGNVTLQAATLSGGSATPDFTISATPPAQTAAPGQTATYNLTVGALNGFTGVVGLAVTGLPTGVTAAFNPATVKGSGTSTLTLTIAAGTAAGNYPLTIAGASGAISHNVGVTLTVPAPAAVLRGSLATPVGPVQLTADGKQDWTHWGLTSVTSFDQKAGVPHQISNYSVVGTRAPSRYANNSVGFTWTDGAPTPTATNSPTGVYVVDQGNGFRITAPADTATRTLKVYVGAWRSRGRMVAHLSDGSAVDYTDNSLSNAAGATTLGVYTFTFTAASAGQTLTVTFTQEAPTVSGTIGNVTIQAATLQ